LTTGAQWRSLKSNQRLPTYVIIAAVTVGVVALALRHHVLNEQTLIFLVVFIPAVMLHEVSHGVVALWCGDDTAKRAGRLTLNPIKHIDPFGSVVVPVVLALTGAPVFGWAKPVPVAINRLRHPATTRCSSLSPDRPPMSSWRPYPASPCTSSSTSGPAGPDLRRVLLLRPRLAVGPDRADPVLLRDRERRPGGVQHASDSAARRFRRSSSGSCRSRRSRLTTACGWASWWSFFCWSSWTRICCRGSSATSRTGT